MTPKQLRHQQQQEYMRAAMLARFIVQRAEPGEFSDPIPEAVAVQQQPKSRSILRWLLVAVALLAFVLLPVIACFAREEFFYVEQTGPRDGSRHPGPHDPGTPSPTSRGLRLEIDGGAVASQSSAYQVTVYTASWCGPCHSMQAKNGSGDSRVSCRYVDAEKEPVPRDVAKIMQELKRKDQANIPLTTWTDGKGCLRWWVGPLSLDQLVAKIESPSNDPPTDQAVGSPRAGQANTSAGVIHGREVIQNLLGKWRHHIGSGAVTFSWSRNGSQTLPMLRLKEWTARSIYGSSGSFNLNVTGAPHSLPVTEGVIDYRLVGDQLRLRGETSIDASLLGIDGLTPKSVGAAQPVGFSPMMILSGISILFQLLNPQMDVVLPGEIAATATMVGDSLVVTFKDAPSVKIVMLFSFNLRVESVSISDSKVVAKFSGSRWISQKTFEVK